MTDPSDRLPDGFQEQVEELESELGRDICGFPDEEFEPCEQWPAEGSSRCATHAGRDLEEAINDFRSPSSHSPQSLTPSKTLNQPRSVGDKPVGASGFGSTVDRFANSYLYWGALVLVGLVLGATAGAFTVDLNQAGSQAPASTTSAGDLDLNVDDPDFNKIRELYREGNHREVVQRLNRLIEETSSRSVKAQVLYFSFVFHQNRENYRRALEMADRYLKEFKDHYRRAEVLYGAWFICSRLTDQPERAKRYRQSLLDEFPDSKWAKRLSS